MTSVHRVVVGLLFAWSVFVPVVAFGQPSGGEQNYEQGKAYFRAGAFREAIVEFETAYALTQRSGALFNIARAYEELGDKAKAIESYDRYLKAPGATRTTEARARATALKRELADAARTAAAAAARNHEAARHVTAARALVTQGKHGEAVERFRRAFAITNDPERVFDIAETLRVAGDKELALGEYERYRKLAPTGRHVAAAGKHIRDIEGELAAANGPPADQSDLTSPPEASAVEAKTRSAKSGTQWRWIAVGAAIIATGIAADVVPDSAADGEINALDFVPLGLYGLGGVFVYAGVF